MVHVIGRKSENLNELEMIEILCRKIMHFTELIAIWTIVNCLVSSPSRALSFKVGKILNWFLIRG